MSNTGKRLKRVNEHRYVMEQFLNRKLKSNECVHHIDFDKLNNDISNLYLCTNSYHRELKYLSYINEYKVILDFIFLRLKTLENLPSSKGNRYFNFDFLTIKSYNFFHESNLSFTNSFQRSDKFNLG